MIKKEDYYDPMDDDDFDPIEAEKNRGVSGKNNPKGGKKTSLKKLDKMIKKEEVSELRKDWGDAYTAIYEKKKLDPVGKEDDDIDNDGDSDSTDKYLKKRRKAIGKAMGKDEDDNGDGGMSEEVTFSETELARIEEIVNSWED